jgi:ankyrin repeat protein
MRFSQGNVINMDFDIPPQRDAPLPAAPVVRPEDEEGVAALNETQLFMDCCRYAEPDDVRILQELLATDRRDEFLTAKDSAGRTALHMASANGHARVAKILVDAGCPKDVPNVEGNTPLHYAAIRNHVETAKVLLEGGWKVEVKNLSNKTALQEISELSFNDMEVLLVKHDPTVDSYAPAEGANVEIDEGASEGEETPVPAPARGPTSAALSQPAHLASASAQSNVSLDEVE